MEECALLEEMAEEDETMDLHNEETFGAGKYKIKKLVSTMLINMT